MDEFHASGEVSLVTAIRIDERKLLFLHVEQAIGLTIVTANKTNMNMEIQPSNVCTQPIAVVPIPFKRSQFQARLVGCWS